MPKASMPASRNSARTAPRKSHSPETMKMTGILAAEYSILYKVNSRRELTHYPGFRIRASGIEFCYNFASLRRVTEETAE
jgi:hypothetical protein